MTIGPIWIHSERHVTRQAIFLPDLYAWGKCVTERQNFCLPIIEMSGNAVSSQIPPIPIPRVIPISIIPFFFQLHIYSNSLGSFTRQWNRCNYATQTTLVHRNFRDNSILIISRSKKISPILIPFLIPMREDYKCPTSSTHGNPIENTGPGNSRKLLISTG